MNENKFNFLMIGIIQNLCSKIKDQLNISYDEAMNLLYHSKLYKALENEETKMWYYSNYDLLRMFLEEITTGSYTICGG